MPLVIKNSMNGLAAIKKIGIPQHLFDWLHASDIAVKLTANQFIFSFTLDGKPQTAAVDVSLSQLQQLNAGALPGHTKALLGQQLADTIGEIKNIAIGGGTITKPAGTMGQLPPLKTNPPKEPVAPKAQQPVSAINVTSLWQLYDLAKIKSDPPTDLRDATKMYQPVKGTSGGSRYFVVAGNDDLRVAARYQSGTLSVRIEGPKWQNHIASIKACGFDMKDQKKNYCSVHLSTPDKVLAQKTLGAVLLGLGVPLDTPMPNLSVIAE